MTTVSLPRTGTGTVDDPWYALNVQLTETDGNVFSLIARVRAALRRSYVADDEIKAFVDQVTGCDSYHDALHTMSCWVHVS